MKILIALFFIGLTGCATAHDYCISHADHYSSYDECYAERTEKHRRMSDAFSHMGDGLQKAASAPTPVFYTPPEPTNCYSTKIGNSVQTSCN